MASNLPTQLLLKSVQTLEKFTGAADQDPSDWLQEIDDLFDAGKVDKKDRRLILQTLFGPDVKNWYRSENVSVDYDEFKQQFIQTFTSSGYRLKIYSKIINRRQRPDETTQSYYYDILSLCAKLNREMPENEKILHLLHGLKPSLVQRVMMHDPSTCKDLLQYAKRAEMVEDISQSSTSPAPPTTPTMDEMAETTAALRRSITHTNYSTGRTSGDRQQSWNYQQQRRPSAYNNNSRPLPQYQRESSSKVVCYNCHGIGHFSYQCPSSLN